MTKSKGKVRKYRAFRLEQQAMPVPNQATDNAAYMAWYRFRLGQQKMPRCTECGSVFYHHACVMSGPNR